MYCKLKSPAKLNLFLHIVDRDSNNYHEIQSLMVFLDLYDEIIITESENLEINFVLNEKIQFPEISTSDNLITKTIRKFEEISGKKVNLKFQINKNIPAGAGLGGGSSNAATIIKFLQQYYECFLSKEEEIKFALPIGCDVVACLNKNPIFVEGIGEKITNAQIEKDLKDNVIVLIVYPQIASSTVDVYKRYKNDSCEFTPTIISPNNFNFEFIKQQHNDLLVPASLIYREISDLNRIISEYNQDPEIIGRMSGSGSTFFLLSKNHNKINEIQKDLKSKYQKSYFVLCKLVA